MKKHVIIALCFLIVPLMSQSQTLFSTFTNYSTSSGPIASAIADFNKDGKMDVATSNYFGVNVNIRFGNGDGTFNSSSSIGLGFYGLNRLGAIASADFNNDTYPDLVIGSFNIPTAWSDFYVCLNLGNGSFGNPYPITSGSSNPYTLDVGDINKDGKMDVVTANYSGATISIISGKGDGTFNLAQRIKSKDTPQAIIMRDFNNDGNPDLLVTSSGTNEIGLFKGNGSSNSFSKIEWYATGSGPTDVDAGDFNGDGILDIAIISGSSGNIYVHKGKGNDSFYTHSTLSLGSPGRGIEVKDFDNDGKIDIAACNEGSNYISIFKGNGNNTFQTREDYTVSSGPHGLVSGDLNNDGRIDLITSNYGNGGGNTFSILLNGGSYPTYSISASAGINGSISPSGSISVNKDSSKTFTFTPNNGYTIDSVIVDGAYAGNGSSYTFSSVQTNHTISVKFRNANYMVSFNGNDERITTGTALISGTGDYSITAWIYGNTVNGDIAGNYNHPGGYDGIEFYIWNGKLISYVSGYLQGGSISAGTWYHVATTRTNGLVKLYINGTEVASGNQAASIGASFGFTIGNHPSTNIEQFNGFIDELRVYGRALSQSEINLIYQNNGSQVSTTNFLLHFPFNEGAGLTTYNQAQNSPNGTLTRTSQWAVSTAPNTGAPNIYPEFSTKPGSLSFDSVLLGFEYSRDLKIYNTGNDTLKVRGISVSDTSFSISSDTFDVLAGDSFTIHIKFKPSYSGYHSITLVFHHNAQVATSNFNTDGYGEPGGITLNQLLRICGCSLKGASFFNRYIGFVTGSNGQLYCTHNGGNTWTLVGTGVSNDLHSVRLIGNAIFITGSNGYISVSYNGGTSWNTFSTGTSNTFYGASFTNASYGFVVGSNGIAYRYSGGSWYPYYLGSYHFYGVFAYGNVAYCVGSGGSIYRYSGGSWVACNSGTGNTFYDVYFRNENYGFAVGQGGLICRTTNGGINWTIINSGTTATCRSIRMVNDLIGYIVCDDGSLLQTQDGGNTWNRVYVGNYDILSIEINGCTLVLTTSDGDVISFVINGCDDSINNYYTRRYCGTSYSLRSASFTSPNNGFVAGYGGTVLSTTNGGGTWVYANTGMSEYIHCIRTIGSLTYICGANGHLCYSSNGGSSWNLISTGTSQTFYGISFVNANRGWAVGSGGVIRFWNGITWSSQNVNSGITFYGIQAIGNTAYAVGSNGTVCKYVNGTWTPINPGVSNTFYGVWFTSENVGYIVGSGGIICKTTNGGASWTALNCGCNTGQTFRCIKSACPSELVVAGDSGMVLTSTNGGITWTKRYLGQNITINSIEWSEGSGYLVGDDGNSYSFNFGGQKDDLSISPAGPLSICPGTSADLTAGGSSAYLWSTSDTSSVINVNSAGTYKVKNGEGICADSAEVAVNIYNENQVITSNVELKTQAQVNAFLSPTTSNHCGNKWTKVVGNLTIDGSSATDPITDLSNLNRLTEVTGYLLIQYFYRTGNPTNLADLASIAKVGRLTVITCPKFENIAFPNLTEASGTVIIRNNINTRSISMPKLETMAGSWLHFQRNHRLEYLGVSNLAPHFTLTHNNGGIDIQKNGDSTANALIIDLNKIKTVKGDFIFSNNSNNGVNNFDNIFGAMDTIKGKLVLSDNMYLSKCCVAANTVVLNGRTISGNTGNCADLTAVSNDCGTLNKRSKFISADNSFNDFASFTIYPNPNKGYFGLEVNAAFGGELHVEIKDLLGREIFSQTVQVSISDNVPLNLSTFPDGQYIVKAVLNGHVFIKRVLIVK